jgi:hypothetical protein
MPYEEFEHHDFADDTLDAQPTGTTRYGSASSWLVKAEGPGGDLTNAVRVTAATGASYLLFNHAGSDGDLHNYPDKIVACIQFDNTKTGGFFAVGFNFDTSTSNGFIGVLFSTAGGNPYYSIVHVDYNSGAWDIDTYNGNTFAFENGKWYVVELSLIYSGYHVNVKIYPLDDQETTSETDDAISGFTSYTDYTGNPHMCLLQFQDVDAKCCWHYMSTFEDPGAAAIPENPEEEEGNAGDGVVEWNLDHELGYLQLNNDWYVQSPSSDPSWSEKETHDFSLDTLGIVPRFTVGDFGNWMVTADGPCSALTNCVYVDDLAGNASMLSFHHENSDPDRGNVNCDAIILVKLSKSYAHRTGLFYFRIQAGTDSYWAAINTYDGTIKLYYDIGGVNLLATANYTFDETKWYCLRLQSYRNTSLLRLKIWEYGYAQPNTWYLSASAVPEVSGNPHATLITAVGGMEAYCAWMSVTNGSATGTAVPDAPTNPTGVEPILGDVTAAFPDFYFETGQDCGAVDFPEFFIGQSMHGYGNVYIDEEDWAVYSGRGGWKVALDFSPEVLASGKQGLNAAGEVEFSEAEVNAASGALTSLTFPVAVVSGGASVVSDVIGNAAISHPKGVIESTAHQGVRSKCDSDTPFPFAVVASTGRVKSVGNGVVLFPLFQVLESSLFSVSGGGDVAFPKAVVHSTGFRNSHGDVAIEFEFDVEAYGRVGDECFHKLMEFVR